jgi:hypothetical protein
MLETHQRAEGNHNFKQSHHDIVKSPNLSRTVSSATKILHRGNKAEFCRLLMEANVVNTEIIEPPYQY